MKILISSHVFYPSIGGIESVSSMLASEFVNQGCEVKLITQSEAKNDDGFLFEIFRRPNLQQLFDLVRWCDVFFHNNISLQTAWPLLLVRKPWVVAHQTWLGEPDGKLSWQDRLKRFLIKSATCISISQAIADRMPNPGVVIGNPYRDDLFYEMPEIDRSIELVFLGRLVSDKGVDILLEALELLKRRALTPQLTIIGMGTELANLQDLSKRLEIADRVHFVGVKTGLELAQLLNAHQIMVVPSRWQEPFGVVALEGIACGCVVVGSEEGGLVDAIGPCGLTFPNCDVLALTQVLCDLLSAPEKMEIYRKAANKHLSNYKVEVIAKKYLRAIEDAVK